MLSAVPCTKLSRRGKPPDDVESDTLEEVDVFKSDPSRRKLYTSVNSCQVRKVPTLVGWSTGRAANLVLLTSLRHFQDNTGAAVVHNWVKAHCHQKIT